MRKFAIAIDSHFKFNRLSASFLDLSGPCPFWGRQGQQSALKFPRVTQLRKHEVRFADTSVPECWWFVGKWNGSFAPCRPPVSHGIKSEEPDLNILGAAQGLMRCVYAARKTQCALAGPPFNPLCV